MTKAKHGHLFGKGARRQVKQFGSSGSQLDGSSGGPAAQVAVVPNVPGEVPGVLHKAERNVSRACAPTDDGCALVSDSTSTNRSSVVGSVNPAEQTGMAARANSLAKKLQAWAFTHQITEVALTELLEILRKRHHFSALPSDGRTLLRTRF